LSGGRAATRLKDRMTIRDIATIGFYGLVFSSVVVWAALRPTHDELASSSGTLRPSSSIAPLERSEMRWMVQHTMLR
jgi:hypothetical protein